MRKQVARRTTVGSGSASGRNGPDVASEGGSRALPRSPPQATARSKSRCACVALSPRPPCVCTARSSHQLLRTAAEDEEADGGEDAATASATNRRKGEAPSA